MAESLRAFLDRFVLPLHRGGPLRIQAPLGVADRERFAAEADLLYDPELRGLRLQRAAELMPEAPLPDPDLSDLSCWMGMHNLYALDHPDRERVWARNSTWEKVVLATRALLHFAAPTDLAEQLARHVSVQRLLDSVRVDQVARLGEESQRYEGQPAPRSVRRMASVGEVDLSEERVVWVDAQHHGAVELLLPELMFVSPLTALLHPTRVEYSFDPRSPARWLRSRSGARAVVHTWARSEDWVETGSALMEGLLRALGRDDLLDQPERDTPAGRLALPAGEAQMGAEAEAGPLMLPGVSDYGRAEHGALLGALIHLHLLKVLAFEARVSLGGRRARLAARAFLSLPLLLPRLRPVLGDPLVGIEDPAALRRWDDYLSHLRGLVPVDALENLVAALVDPVVQEDAA